MKNIIIKDVELELNNDKFKCDIELKKRKFIIYQDFKQVSLPYYKCKFSKKDNDILITTRSNLSIKIKDKDNLSNELVKKVSNFKTLRKYEIIAGIFALILFLIIDYTDRPNYSVKESTFKSTLNSIHNNVKTVNCNFVKKEKSSDIYYCAYTYTSPTKAWLNKEDYSCVICYSSNSCKATDTSCDAYK